MDLSKKVRDALIQKIDPPISFEIVFTVVAAVCMGIGTGSIAIGIGTFCGLVTLIDGSTGCTLRRILAVLEEEDNRQKSP